MRLTYLAHTQPGFEVIAADEIGRRLEGVHIRGTRVVADKNGMVLFDSDGDVRDLMALRTIEDLFVVVAALGDLPSSREALRRLETAALRATTFEAGGNLVRQIQPGIAGRADRQWRLEEEGALEFWLTLFPHEALLALRLSDERMRQRDYKIENLPASLRPSAAAALVWLTHPQPDDVFLDPMCGAGTCLIERAQAGRYSLLLGGDVREEAVAVALRNIGAPYKPLGIRRWDARRLPLDASSVSACAVNLPFGKQIGTHEENRTLYPAFLDEMARVLKGGARLVALTGDTRTFAAALQHTNRFARRTVYPVRVLGQPAKVYVLDRV